MSGHDQREPEAELGLLDATMIGMGAMIGAGIFVLTGLAADISGPAALLVFMLNGVVTAFTGLSYAELASRSRKAVVATRSYGRSSTTSARSSWAGCSGSRI